MVGNKTIDETICDNCGNKGKDKCADIWGQMARRIDPLHCVDATPVTNARMIDLTAGKEKVGHPVEKKKPVKPAPHEFGKKAAPVPTTRNSSNNSRREPDKIKVACPHCNEAFMVIIPD